MDVASRHVTELIPFNTQPCSAVAGWLNAQTLLLEANILQGHPACATLLTAAVDGPGSTKLGDGAFLALANGAQP